MAAKVLRIRLQHHQGLRFKEEPDDDESSTSDDSRSSTPEPHPIKVEADERPPPPPPPMGSSRGFGRLKCLTFSWLYKMWMHFCRNSYFMQYK